MKRFHLLNIKDTYEGNYHGGWLGGCSVNKLRNVKIYTNILLLLVHFFYIRLIEYYSSLINPK